MQKYKIILKITGLISEPLKPTKVQKNTRIRVCTIAALPIVLCIQCGPQKTPES
jgi:hypothetical protein